MGINHHPLRHKRVNALHQLQGAAPLLFNTFLAKIAKVLAQHRFAAARQAEGIFISAPSQQRRDVSSHGGSGSASGT